MLMLWTCLFQVGKSKLSKNIVWKSANACVAVASVLAILISTLFFRGESSEMILMPFHSFIEVQTEPEIYRSMLMNMFLFFPLGLTLPHVLPEEWKHQVTISILLALFFSAAIEYSQYYFSLGRAETDDVICNTLGAAIGTLSYTLERKFFTK